ncbi:MAG: carboxypeptidase regulatory-like domain-containing protein, partial [Pyrinomonadaceae bacterium]
MKNLSAVTRKEAMRMVRASDGNICIRYITNPVTQRPMFAEQVFQITRRAPGFAAGVMTASLSLSTAAYAQSESTTSMSAQTFYRTDAKKFAEPVISGEKNQAKVETPVSSRNTGTISDQNGGVIPNAKVTIYSVNASKTAETTTDAEGVYKFEKLEPGTYRIESESPGFMRSVVTNVRIADAEETVADATLGIGIEVTVDVVANVELEVVSVSGGMISVDYSSPLARAVSADDIAEVRDRIINGANVNGKDENYDKITPLFIAVENGNIEMVQLLLD